ncbi:hypothetical protein R1flu_000643 [Riccia fluitans]|uniref:Uncharacterized protein n=1 Tax=Riccia fluitans TaxID=41844 RepID=A0ABD1Y118_9MARC
MNQGQQMWNRQNDRAASKLEYCVRRRSSNHLNGNGTPHGQAGGIKGWGYHEGIGWPRPTNARGWIDDVGASQRPSKTDPQGP